MNCTHCNTENEEQALFCSNCGVDLYKANASDVSSKKTDTLLLVFLAINSIVTLAQFYIQNYVDNWIESPLKYAQAAIWILQNLSFILIPLAIRNNSLKLIGLMVTIIIGIYWMYNNIKFMIQ